MIVVPPAPIWTFKLVVDVKLMGLEAAWTIPANTGFELSGEITSSQHGRLAEIVRLKECPYIT